ncbi:hypothetical protein CY35_07G039200 [Sphagnum magellanicum]|uniref:Uncharacterized protein n=1 Tax=Sphagnum magellanicum TaxID=128215 RepID=A0ACB8HLL1_9BRYO|nr:hypothetical protein CY35_07G039200 [Sphagnum magellanicum]
MFTRNKSPALASFVCVCVCVCRQLGIQHYRMCIYCLNKRSRLDSHLHCIPLDLSGMCRQDAS